MNLAAKGCVLILAATLAAAALRLPQLARRPMHADEAVHAVKFGRLLQTGRYQYDPHQYHGPTLNLFTLIGAWLNSADCLAEISETTLRIVPVVFGLLLVLLTIGLLDGLGPAAIVAAALTAISPAFVYYSRYYIHEMLLTCFTFAAIVCAYRYFKSPKLYWALLVGTSIGLMHATKETWIIAAAAMALAVLLTRLIQPQTRSAKPDVQSFKPWHILAGIAAAIAVSALFYSCFFTHPAGILDSLQTYTTYLHRAGHDQNHIHPWYYYLKMLIYFRCAGGPAWSEALIILLAVAAMLLAFAPVNLTPIDRHLLRFLAFYALIMTAAYSAIGYKTPWCLLQFFHPVILLAACGAVAIVKFAPNKILRTAVIILLAASSTHLAWQSCLANFRYAADPANPYVYAHTCTDVFRITKRVNQVVSVHPAGRCMPIDVICPGNDYWPLPWYFRHLEHVAWYNHVDMNTPPPALIIAAPAVKPKLIQKLYQLPPPGKKQLYVPLFDSYTQLRPGVELLGFITKDLHDRLQQQHRTPPGNR